MPRSIPVLLLSLLGASNAVAQLGIPKPAAREVVVRPKEIDDVLNNPGIGFQTFQRFNGDDLNPGIRWTEGHPIEYQPFHGDLTNRDYPATTTAYFRVYWRFVEPERETYDWPMIDKALKTAAERGQTLCLRIAPYAGGEDEDVPAWYRAMVGPEPNLPSDKWRTRPTSGISAASSAPSARATTATRTSSGSTFRSSATGAKATAAIVFETRPASRC
jgi:hypothetical protein